MIPSHGEVDAEQRDPTSLLRVDAQIFPRYASLDEIPVQVASKEPSRNRILIGSYGQSTVSLI